MAKIEKSKIPQRSKEYHTIRQRRGSKFKMEVKNMFQYKVQLMKLINELIIREIKDLQNYSNIFVSGNYQDEVLIPVKSEENLEFLINLKIRKPSLSEYT